MRLPAAFIIVTIPISFSRPTRHSRQALTCASTRSARYFVSRPKAYSSKTDSGRWATRLTIANLQRNWEGRVRFAGCQRPRKRPTAPHRAIRTGPVDIWHPLTVCNCYTSAVILFGCTIGRTIADAAVNYHIGAVVPKMTIEEACQLLCDWIHQQLADVAAQQAAMEHYGKLFRPENIANLSIR